MAGNSFVNLFILSYDAVDHIEISSWSYRKFGGESSGW